jgi:hypothetical protein
MTGNRLRAALPDRPVKPPRRLRGRDPQAFEQEVKFTKVSDIDHGATMPVAHDQVIMLDTQNQGPQCTACGSPMKLMAIEPSSTGQDLRTFSCPQCKRVQRHLIDSAVTEAWLDSQHQRQKSITHEVEGGRMIAKPAK